MAWVVLLKLSTRWFPPRMFAFISGMAGLPRIVTLHDFTIKASGDDSSALGMNITAKTYRYKDGDS